MSKLRELRYRAGYTRQADLGAVAGLDAHTVSQAENIESGGNPTLSTLVKLGRALSRALGRGEEEILCEIVSDMAKRKGQR